MLLNKCLARCVSVLALSVGAMPENALVHRARDPAPERYRLRSKQPAPAYVQQRRAKSTRKTYHYNSSQRSNWPSRQPGYRKAKECREKSTKSNNQCISADKQLIQEALRKGFAVGVSHIVTQMADKGIAVTLGETSAVTQVACADDKLTLIKWPKRPGSWNDAAGSD